MFVLTVEYEPSPKIFPKVKSSGLFFFGLFKSDDGWDFVELVWKRNKSKQLTNQRSNHNLQRSKITKTWYAFTTNKQVLL